MSISKVFKILVLSAAFISGRPLIAKGWLFHLGLNTVPAGTLNIGSTHSISEFSQYLALSKELKLRYKLWRATHVLHVDAYFSNGDVTYKIGAITRKGYHLRLGGGASVHSQWSKKFTSFMSVYLLPLSTINIFSRVNTSLNGEEFTSTSRTQLNGYGLSIIFGGGMWYQFRLLGGKHRMNFGPTLGINMESFSSRGDQTIQINNSTGAVSNAKSENTGSFTSQYLSLSLQASYPF